MRRDPVLCLINPPHAYLVDPDAQAPLGLLYVAAAVRERGFEVTFVNLSSKHHSEMAHVVFPKADVYGITGTVLDRRSVHAVSAMIKMQHLGATVVVGGPITLSRDMLDWVMVDSFVMGEAEEVIFDVLKDWPRVKREYYGRRITDLDSLPLPARDLLGDKLGGNVFAHRKSKFGDVSTVISTSRGCPSACAFCASVNLWKRKIIYRSPESVAAEIRHVIDTYGVRQFRFSDDNITASRARLLKLCDALRGMDIAWRASIRVKPHDPDMFKEMKAAGCFEVCFGTESADPNVLDALGKRISPLDSELAMKHAKEVGLVVRILTMVGTPGMTTRTVDMEMDFLTRNRDNYDSVALTNFAPLPGTKVYEQPELCGCEILDRNIDHYNLCFYGSDGEANTWRNLVRPVGMTLEQLTADKIRLRKFVEDIGKVNRG
jgi:anaerobic magnesium-protoporphyrin IX monomethyl ester cyclase